MFIEARRLKPESTGRKSSSNLVCQRLLIVLFAAAMVVPSSGCTSNLRLGSLGFGDALLESYRDRVWAKRAYNLRYNNCDRPYESHFQTGFIAGYCDTCNGGDGYVPALPPNEYRGFEFQSPDGAQCVKSWFEGFPAGVAAAKKDRAGEFHDIYTSRMINSAITHGKTKHVLPNDVPVLSTNQFGVPQRTKAPKSPPAPLDNSIVGSEDTSVAYDMPYVAPPETANNPILNPRSLQPSDLIAAPEIRKTGPAAMASISKIEQFTIDPSVKVQSAITNSSAPTIATNDEILSSNSAALPMKNESNDTLPPIVSTPRSQVVSYPTAQPPIVQSNDLLADNVPPPVPTPTASQTQTPLPMAVRSAGNDWQSQTSSRRR